MYAPPEDRSHPLLAQLARLGSAPARAAAPFASQLAAAHADLRQAVARPSASAAGLSRTSRLRAIALG